MRDRVTAPAVIAVEGSKDGPGVLKGTDLGTGGRVGEEEM